MMHVSLERVRCCLCGIAQFISEKIDTTPGIRLLAKQHELRNNGINMNRSSIQSAHTNNNGPQKEGSTCFAL